MISTWKAAIAAALALGSAPAFAATSVTFGMTGSMADNGTYGNALTPTSVGGINLRVTGWQINQSTGAITSAYTGAYSPGTGVTGVNDANGANGYHQIDNAFGYTDFLLLQFDRSVTLSSAFLNSFQMANVSGIDNDLSFAAVNVPEAAWNSAVSLTGYTSGSFNWSTVLGNGANGNVTLAGSNVSSNQWLIGAGLSTGANDGFKVASVTVTPAVPEPATWAMMLLGFGAAGLGLRRRPRPAPQAA